MSDIEKELNELRESQDRGKAAMENSVSEASLYLQDQVNSLWPRSGQRVGSLALTNLETSHGGGRCGVTFLLL